MIFFWRTGPPKRGLPAQDSFISSLRYRQPEPSFRFRNTPTHCTRLPPILEHQQATDEPVTGISASFLRHTTDNSKPVIVLPAHMTTPCAPPVRSRASHRKPATRARGSPIHFCGAASTTPMPSPTPRYNATLSASASFSNVTYPTDDPVSSAGTSCASSGWAKLNWKMLRRSLQRTAAGRFGTRTTHAGRALAVDGSPFGCGGPGIVFDGPLFDFDGAVFDFVEAPFDFDGPPFRERVFAVLLIVALVEMQQGSDELRCRRSRWPNTMKPRLRVLLRVIDGSFWKNQMQVVIRGCGRCSPRLHWLSVVCLKRCRY